MKLAGNVIELSVPAVIPLVVNVNVEPFNAMLSITTFDTVNKLLSLIAVV